MKYEVTKKQRGTDGRWFAYPSRRFRGESEAMSHAHAMAAAHAGITSTRIVVTRRRGAVCLADIECEKLQATA